MLLDLLILDLLFPYNPNSALSSKKGSELINRVCKHTGYSKEIAKAKIAKVLIENKTLRSWQNDVFKQNAIIDLVKEQVNK